MHMRLSIFRLMLGAALAISISVVQAQTIEYTVTGTLFSSTGQFPIYAFDDAGLFGPAGTSLVGDNVTETIVANVDGLTPISQTGSTEYLGGGLSPFVPSGSPTLASATLTVNGRSQTIPGNTLWSLSLAQTPSGGSFSSEIESSNSIASIDLKTMTLPISFTTPYTYSGAGLGSGTFSIQGGGATGVLMINSITVGSVPEPASFVVVLSGLVVLAIVFSRRRSREIRSHAFG